MRQLVSASEEYIKYFELPISNQERRRDGDAVQSIQMLLLLLQMVTDLPTNGENSNKCSQFYCVSSNANRHLKTHSGEKPKQMMSNP